MEKIYIGFSLGFNASACVISNKRGILSAISQERFSGIKNTKEIPIDAILKCCELAKVKSVDGIAYSHYQGLTKKEIQRYIGEKFKKDFSIDFSIDLIKLLEKNGITCKDGVVVREDHHTSHVLSTVGIFGFRKNSLIISSDGFGDGLSGTVVYMHGSDLGKMKVLSEVKLAESVALVYQFVTGALGFKEHQHEGKVTGLAAYGEPLYLDSFENLYAYTNDYRNSNGFNLDESQLESLTLEEKEQVKESMIVDFDKFLRLKKTIYNLVADLLNGGAEKKDIAASVQRFSEAKTVNWILSVLSENQDLKVETCMLTGGLFANVNINRKLHRAGKNEFLFDNILIAPCVGDEGTCIGAAVAASLNNDDGYICGDSYKSVLKGMKMNVDEIDFSTEEHFTTKFMTKHGLSKYVADALAENKIVCLCRDELEFGPRALCHRSILFNCSDKSSTNWLNEQLGRTEFMPFAPVCRDIDAGDLFHDIEGAEESAKFMSVNFDCKPEFVENYPAACHVDNSGRPQILSKNDDDFLYNVLTRYNQKTGLKALVNTSFNMHNSPIVSTVKEALESWKQSGADILVIDNFVFERER